MCDSVRSMCAVQSPPRVSEESLLDFLQATGLPLVSRLGAFVSSLSLGLGLASLAYGIAAMLLWGEALWSAHAPWGGALPSLLSAPLYGYAWWSMRRGRLQLAGLLLFAALLCVSVLASWLRGAFYPGWYAQPILAMLASCCLGIVPGLSLALVAAIAMSLAPLEREQALLPGIQSDLWLHSMSLIALTLGSALTGVLVHKVLIAALLTGEQHRRRELEHARALRYREKLLRHALRVETVGDLAGLVTHQLRNAFQVMIGHVTLNTLDGEEKPGERLRLVGETLEQSRPLLDQLMALAHPDDGVIESGDLNEWVAAFCQRAQRVMPASIAVEFLRCSAVLQVQLDPRGLEHALWNLAINARHAMANGGTLRVVTELVDGFARVEVVDTGCGIAPEVQQRIFDPYFTTKPVGQGTGLGLTAVERFVRASQGRIEVLSEPGRGAAFVLHFPLATPVAVHTA